jgi:hypothetical protein
MRRAKSVVSGAAVAFCLLNATAGAASLELLPPTPIPLPQKLRAMLRPRAQFSAPRSSYFSHFDLSKRRFRVGVAGVGDAVLISVERGHHVKSGRAVTTYLARGSVSPRRLAASFGDLGKVDVRFRPSGRVLRTKPRRHCIGPHRYTIRLGAFIGEIRFRGEDGYLSLDAHRVKGRVRYPRHLNCRSTFPPFRPGRHRRHRHKVKPALFGVFWHHAVDSTAFVALRGLFFVPRGKVLYLAETEHTAGRVGVLHEAIQVGSPRGFTVDNALTRASLTPRGPFDGTGLYAAAPDGTKTWSGSLSVSFPGEPHFPLTGSQFEPILEAGF